MNRRHFMKLFCIAGPAMLTAFKLQDHLPSPDLEDIPDTLLDLPIAWTSRNGKVGETIPVEWSEFGWIVEDPEVHLKTYSDFNKFQEAILYEAEEKS